MTQDVNSLLPTVLYHPAREARPEGLRASIYCDVQRVRREVARLQGVDVDELYKRTFPLGVARIGDRVEQDAIEFHLRPLAGPGMRPSPPKGFDAYNQPIYDDKYRIKWECGETELDAVLPPGGKLHGTFEIKSRNVKADEVVVPSKENIKQAKLNIVLSERNFTPLPMPYWILIYDKVWGKRHGPFPVTVNNAERAALGAMIEATVEVLARWESIDITRREEFAPLECVCAECFPKERVRASQALETLLDSYVVFDENVSDVPSDAATRAAKRELRDSILLQVGFDGPDVIHETEDYDVSVTKRGSLMVKRRVRERQAA